MDQNKAKYYTMIAWIALSFFFLMQAIIGLFISAIGGNIVPFERISLSTIIVIAAGSILLIEVLMRFMDRPEEGETPQTVPVKPKMSFKSMLFYLVLVVVILIAGMALRHVLPVLIISPWVSLILSVIGFIGLKLIFLRKKTS